MSERLIPQNEAELDAYLRLDEFRVKYPSVTKEVILKAAVDVFGVNPKPDAENPCTLFGEVYEAEEVITALEKVALVEDTEFFHTISIAGKPTSYKAVKKALEVLSDAELADVLIGTRESIRLATSSVLRTEEGADEVIGAYPLLAHVYNPNGTDVSWNQRLLSIMRQNWKAAPQSDQ